QRWRNFEAERPCGLQVDDELELDCSHDGQVGRFLALKTAAGVDARLAELLRYAWSVAHQPAGFGKLARGIDRGQQMACCQRGKLHAIVVEQGAGSEHKGLNPLLHDAGKGFSDVVTGGSIKYVDPPSDARSAHLHVFDQRLVDRIADDKRRKPLCIWYQLVQEAKPFRTKLCIHGADAGNVAARLIETAYEAGLNGVAAHAEDDRN